MTGLIKKAGLGVALAAATIASATPASAQRWHGGYGGYHHYGHGDVAGAAILGGIVGLGVGAAIASNHDRYYDRGYYGGYYGPPRGYYYDEYRPRCWSQWRWDPYYGHNVPVRVCR